MDSISMFILAYPGLISSIAFCPDYSGLFAASSLSSAISLYSEATGEDPIAFLDGMSSAVTQARCCFQSCLQFKYLIEKQVKFNPSQPHLLYASQRRSNDILCWDVREPLEVLKRYTRKGSRTNQKIMFDIDLSGRWLASGDEVRILLCSEINWLNPKARMDGSCYTTLFLNRRNQSCPSKLMTVSIMS